MPTRQLAAIMFSDIAGYTAMMQTDETLGREKAKRYRKVLEEQVAAHQGEVIQHYGDGSMSIFQSAVEAAKCAKAVQIALQQAPGVPLRIGIHIGDIVRDGDDIYGDGVNMASRVESMGVPGAVLMTERVIHDLRSHPDLATQSLGKFAFKNVDEPVEVFALTDPRLTLPRIEEMQGKGTPASPPASTGNQKTFIRGLVYGFLGVALGVMIWAGYAMTSRNDQMASVKVVDEQGNTITRQMPTLAATRRMVMFPLEDQTGDPQLDWCRTGLPMLLNFELEQDMRVYFVPPLALKEYYADYNHEFLQDIPFSSCIKIAQDLYSDHFITGKLLQRNDSLVVALNLFGTETGQSTLKVEVCAADPYQLVDLMHIRLAEAIFPGETEAGMGLIDLPAADLISPRIDVLENYCRAYQLYLTNFNLAPQAMGMMQAAVEADPNCAECYVLLSQLFLTGDKSGEQVKETIARALDLSATLPERQQLLIKSYYYQTNNAPDKQRGLLETWKELYPSDLNPYLFLINQYQQTLEFDKAKVIAKEASDRGHKGQILLVLASLYSKTGDYQEAEKYYDEYAHLYPAKLQKLTELGNLYVNQGQLEKAKAYFEKLLVVNPAYVPVAVKLANTEARLGHLEQAKGMLEQLLTTAHTAKDSVSVYKELESYYQRLGQYKQSLKVAEPKWTAMSSYLPEPALSQIRFMEEISILADLSMDAEHARRLAVLEKLIPSSAHVFECVGNYRYAQQKKQAEEFEKWTNACEPILIQYMGENFQYLSRTSLHNLKGEYQQAVKSFETYIEKTGVSQTSLGYSISEMYRKAGQPQEAMKQMEALLSTDPYQSYWIIEQAKNYHALGEDAKAREWYEKGMNLLKNADPDSRDYQEARAFGKELEAV
jgi:class 3 adenylate cyclase/tetratricopeptide (TPR) repeat protein